MNCDSYTKIPKSYSVEIFTCILMFIGALDTVLKTWEQPSTQNDDGVKKLWYRTTMKATQLFKKKKKRWNLAICCYVNETRLC